MKRLLILGLSAIAIVLFACNGKGGVEPAVAAADGKDSTHQAMLKANREVQHAIETGDTVTLRKYISSDATDHGGGPNGADLKGDDIVKMLANVHNDIDNLKFETLEEAANDDHIFAMVHVTGTTKRPVWGMPANFKMDSKSVDVIKVKDLKMVDHWNFADPAEMMKMMNPTGGKRSNARRSK